MSLLTGMKGVASSLLSKFGESVTFSREVSSGFDPVTGEDTTTTTTFTGSAHPSPYELSEVDGTLVQSGDIRLLVENPDTTPAQGDEVTFRSKGYRVMSVDPISVQGGDAAYYVQVRV